MGGCIKRHIRILVFCNIILIIGFCESTSAFQSHGPQTAKDNKPHIVIILADDMVINLRVKYQFKAIILSSKNNLNRLKYGEMPEIIINDTGNQRRIISK